MKSKTKINKKKKELRKDKIATIFIYGILIFAIVVLFFTAKSMFFPVKSMAISQDNPMQEPQVKKMSLTSYDKELARQMMDKNGDGKCDACGMPVEMCIESGQLQCDMDSKSTIGILQSQHMHADLKVYLNGEEIDFSNYAHMERMQQGFSVSSFIHVDSGAPAPEKAGDVLHMHATGVPLWIFFDSIEMKFPDSIKVYINGQLNSQGLDYVFNDLDKILITDGKGNLQEQLNSVTDFAKNH